MSVVAVVCCQVEVSATDRYQSRRVLPSVVRLSVIVEPQRGGVRPVGTVEL